MEARLELADRSVGMFHGHVAQGVSGMAVNVRAGTLEDTSALSPIAQACGTAGASL